MCTPDCCLALLAVVFPPVAVCLKRGCCTADFFINIGLFLLGYLPGLLHAWYIIFNHPECTRHDPRRLGHAAPSGVYVVASGSPTSPHQQQQHAADATSYGAVGSNRPAYLLYSQNSPPPNRGMYVYQGTPPQFPPRPGQQQPAECAPAPHAGVSTASHPVPGHEHDHLSALQQQHTPQQQKERPPIEHVSSSGPDGGSSSSAVPAEQQRPPPAGSAASLIPSAPQLEEVIDAPPRYEEIDSKFI